MIVRTLLVQGSANQGIGLGGFSFGYSAFSNSYFTGQVSTLSNRATITYRIAGRLSNVCWNVSANTLTGSLTYNSFINGGIGGMLLSIPALSSGFFEDTTGFDIISSGTTVAGQMNVVGNVGEQADVTTCVSIFKASTGVSAHRLSSYTQTLNITVASSTNYFALGGRLDALNTTANRAEQYIGSAGSLKNFYVFIPTNTRATISTARVQKNGGNTALAIGIGGGLTGIFEDTDTEAVALGDLCNYSFTVGTGTNPLNVADLAVAWECTSPRGLIMFGYPGAGFNTVYGGTRYICCGGASTLFTTENPCQTKALNSFVASRLSIFVATNAAVSTTTVALRVNNATTLLSVSIGGTGRVTDITNSVSVAQGDLFNYRVSDVAGGVSGVKNIRTISMTAEYPLDSEGLSVPVLKCGTVIGY